MAVPSPAKPVFTQLLIHEALGLGPKDPELGFSQVTIDSRQVEAGALYIPIQGEKYDGHDFIQAAAEKGAIGIVHELHKKLPPLPAEFEGKIVYYPVKSTQEALRSIAQKWWFKHSVVSIIVAGSVGKTTTKEMLTALLQGQYAPEQILKTKGSENGFLGIPLTLLKLRKGQCIAVIEVGIDDIGAMQKHLDYLQASAATVTAIAEEHLFQLKNMETVAAEECLALSNTAQNGGTVVINVDDPYLLPWAEKLAAFDTICVSLQSDFLSKHPGNDLAYRNLLTGKISQQTLILNGLKFKNFAVPLLLPGEHNARNLLIAIALARTVGQLSDPEITAGMSHFAGQFTEAYGRSDLQKLTLKNGQNIQVICDYYNANPASMEAAFKVLQDLAATIAKPGGQTWLCLGEMRELGEDEIRYHQGLASSIISRKFNHVLLLGPLMKELEKTLKKQGFPGKTQHFSDHASLSQALQAGLKSNDMVLIKGSRGMTMEKIWQALRD